MNEEPIPIPGAAPPITPDASNPAPINPAPPDDDPFKDDQGGQIVELTPTPLLERMRLHFKQSNVKSTLGGALSHFGDTAVERGALTRGFNPSDLENENIDRAVKTRDDLAAYDRMPGAEGYLEYGAAIVGSIAGNVASPESAIGNVFKIPYLATKGVIGRMTEFGVNQAFVNTATDPWIQSLNLATKDGTRDKYDFSQTFIESPIGGFVGGALLKGAHEAGSALFIRPQAEKDALTFFRLLRDHGGPDEQKRWPEIYDEVQGKSDKQLGDMAKDIAADDKAAGDNAKAPAKPPPLPEEAKPPEPELPPWQSTDPKYQAEYHDRIAAVSDVDAYKWLADNGRGLTARQIEAGTPFVADQRWSAKAAIALERWKSGEARPGLAQAPEAPEIAKPATSEPAPPLAPVDDATLIGQRAPNMQPHRVATADGKSIDVAPIVVEAADLKASSDAGYDPTLQPRDRDRAASQAQIAHITARLDPERLGQSAEADRGSAIVGPDGMVESGNGRVMAIREAYAQKGDAAQRYRDWLTSQGIDVTQYKEPVLVRQRTTELTPEERKAFTVAANQSVTLSMSASERALADARLLGSESLDLIRNADDLGAIGNRDFVRSFISKLPQTEQGAMVTAEGGLSSEGLTRVRNAVLARAYGDAHVLTRIAEATDDEVKSISNALVSAAPHWARLRADVEAGRVRKDIDITPELIEAVQRTADLRARGGKLESLLAQQDAFDTMSEGVEQFMRMFYNKEGRRAASSEKISDGLRFYAEQGAKVSADGGLDLGMTPVLSRDILRTAVERGFNNDRQAGLFERGGPSDGAGAKASGGEAPRPGAGDERGRLGEAGAAGDTGRQAGAGTEGAGGTGDLLASVADKRSAAEIKYFGKGPSKPIGVNERGQTVYENAEGIRSVWNKADGMADKEGYSRYGDVITPNEPRPARYRTTTERPEGIGDVLASKAEASAGGGDQLDVAVRRMQYSAPRESELTRTNLTTNLMEAPNLRALWQDLADELGATVRAGRVIGSKNTAGQYFTRTGVIRMRQFDDLVVVAHELGHHVEVEYGKPLNDIIHQTPGTNFSVFGGRELDFMSNYAASHQDPVVRRKEGFAEFFRLLIEHPAEADRRAPNFMQDFNKFLANEPELKATIEKAQRSFDDYRMANAEDLVDANIHTTTELKGWAKLRNDVRNDGFWNTITERGSQVYTGLLDEHNALAVAVQALLKTRKDNTSKIISLLAADDAYKLIRLAGNAHQAGMIDLMHGVTPYHANLPEGPSLHDAIALATGKPNILSGWDDAAVNSFSGYLIARRGVFEWERRAAGRLNQDPMPLPKDVYEKKIEVYEKANPNASAAADMVHEWTHNLLKKELEAGLITRESYDNALQVRDYVPLMRDMSDKSNLGGGDAFNAETVGIRQFRGSARPIIDPLESLMERSFRTAQLIAHNDAITALGNLATKAGVGGGKLVEHIPASEIKARYVDPLEALRKSLQENGVSKTDADLAISNMLNDLRIDEQDMGPVAIFRSQQAAERGENIVFYLSGGEMKALRLKEGEFGKELIMSLTGGMSPQLRDWNLAGMTKVSQILRVGVTTSPDFFITNMLRDQMATWILNRGTLPLIDSFRGIWREITNSELSRTYAQMGGIAGGANLNAIDHARIDKDIQSLASKGFTVARLASFEGLFKIIELSETASRGGLFEVSYKRALKQGLSPYEASVEAAFTANDNLDFGRHGSRLGNTIKLIPFLNAQLQGLDKAWRTLVTPAFKEALTKQDVEAQKTMLSAYAKIAGLTGASMALRANYMDDPEYSELSPYMRNTHWMVRIPGAKGNKIVDMTGRTIEVPPGLQNLWLAIPKPFELAILPNLGERAVEMLHNHDPQALWRWATGALDLVSAKTMMSSVGIKTAAEMYSGKDFFTGRDIVPEHLKGLEPWAQASAGTSTLSKYIGDATNRVHKSLGIGPEGGLSPMYIDQLIKGVGGSQSRNMLSLFDSATGTKGDQSLADTAIARRVFKEAYRGSTSATEFWDQVADKTGKLSQAASTYDALLSNPAAAANYVAGLSEDKRVFVVMTKSDFAGDEKQLHPLVNAHKAMTAISNMKREIANGTLSEAATLDPIKLSPSEQRVSLDALSRIQMFTARNSLIDAGTLALKGQKPGALEADMEALEKTVPSVYAELSQRYANAKVYKASAIAEHWNEVKRTVIDEGSSAKLGIIAREVQRDGYELDEKPNKKKKVRPVVPGALEPAN